MLKASRLVLIVCVIMFLLTAPITQAQDNPSISISTTSGAPGDRVTISANMSGLLCDIIDTRGIDAINEGLGATNASGNLTFSVPDWDPVGYSIRCTLTSGTSVVATSNTLSFTITEAGPALLQPYDYFTPGWTPPWTERLSNYVSQVNPTNQRVRRTITISQRGVDFTMTIDASNSTTFNDYIGTTEVFFEVRSAPVNFRLPTDSVPVGSCQLPPLMTEGHRGRILPEPPLENRLRESPSLSGQVIGAIQPREEFDVLEGPVCRDGVNWWRVQQLDGAVGWTAEGVGTTYYAETYAEVNVDISATHHDPTSETNVLYFFIDPTLNLWDAHSYQSLDDHSASIRVRALGGEIRLSMWRTSPVGGYWRTTTAQGGSYTDWLQHDSGETLADYSARVTGLSDAKNLYYVYGTMILR